MCFRLRPRVLGSLRLVPKKIYTLGGSLGQPNLPYSVSPAKILLSPPPPRTSNPAPPTSELTHLGSQNILIPRPVQLLKRAPHLDLALARRVRLGRVEEVDAVVPGRLHALLDDVALLRAAIGEPAAQREDRDLQARGAQVSEYHVLGVEGGSDCHGCWFLLRGLISLCLLMRVTGALRRCFKDVSILLGYLKEADNFYWSKEGLLPLLIICLEMGKVVDFVVELGRKVEDVIQYGFPNRLA